MSKKNRNRGSNTSSAPSGPAAPRSRTALFFVAALAIAIGLGGMTWIAFSSKATSRTDVELAALQRTHAATLGNPGAPVHIVEFLDPACETCAQFFPLVKGLMKDHQGYIRLSVRLVPFHRNSDIAVKALEAAKAQGKFWDMLERLLATQSTWVIGHTVDADKLWTVLRSLDLDVARLQADMASPAVQQSMAADMADARILKVTATPEYFVNGRGLPDFGYEQLRALVEDEVRKAKRS